MRDINNKNPNSANFTNFMRGIAISLALSASFSSAFSQENLQDNAQKPASILAPPQKPAPRAPTAPPTSPAPIAMRLLVPELTVFAAPQDYKKLAGSGAYLSPADLAIFADTDINAILEEVPGVYIQEEDGYGLRPNIGMRAAMADRSSKITLMEDGILIAPAPYAQPSAYYFPRAGRMSGVEVVKGPSAIRFGPYTIGGAINLISTPIPDTRQGTVKLRAGSDGASDVHLIYGDVLGQWSFVAETIQESADGFKTLPNGDNTGFDIGSFVAKARYTPDDGNQYVEVKYEYTDEVSQETYYGLSDADFAANPYQRYAGTQSDVMDSEHWQAVVTHHYAFAHGATLKTQIYKTWFDRNWYKLERVGNSNFATVINDATKFAVLKGGDSAAACLAAPSAASCGDTDLDVKANNRQYQALGAQSRLNFDLGNHALEIGYRVHKDEMTRVQWTDAYYMASGELVKYFAAVPGATGGSDNRFEEAHARSFHVYDAIDLNALTVTLGLRHENIAGKRIARLTGDVEKDTAYKETSLALGMTYEVTPELLLIGGVYEGFNAAGVANDRGETANNFEAGLRYVDGTDFVELIGFASDFDNLIGICTASSGCDTVGDTYDGGAVVVAGVEFSAQTEITFRHVTMPLGLTYTLTDTEFKTNFEAAAYDLWGSVRAGDELPYVARHQLGLSLGLTSSLAGRDSSSLAGRDKWNATMRVKYKSEQRSVAGSGTIARAEKIDSFIVTDISAAYKLTPRVKLALYVNNLFDKRYAVSRHPDGLRPGLSRSWALGVTAKF